jgi:ABC-type transport system involved in cytochrome bd biosynthesis fused ATPase/permease subunit
MTTEHEVVWTILEELGNQVVQGAIALAILALCVVLGIVKAVVATRKERREREERVRLRERLEGWVAGQLERQTVGSPSTVASDRRTDANHSE